MGDSRYLLDTSAILSFIEDEEGAERVDHILRHEETLLPFPVLFETYYISLREQSEDIADKRYALLKQLPASFLLELDEPTLLTAGRLKAHFRISLAGAIIAAFAVQQEFVLVHKDPELEALAETVQQEILLSRGPH